MKFLLLFTLITSSLLSVGAFSNERDCQNKSKYEFDSKWDRYIVTLSYTSPKMEKNVDLVLQNDTLKWQLNHVAAKCHADAKAVIRLAKSGPHKYIGNSEDRPVLVFFGPAVSFDGKSYTDIRRTSYIVTKEVKLIDMIILSFKMIGNLDE